MASTPNPVEITDDMTVDEYCDAHCKARIAEIENVAKERQQEILQSAAEVKAKLIRLSDEAIARLEKRLREVEARDNYDS